MNEVDNKMHYQDSDYNYVLCDAFFPKIKYTNNIEEFFKSENLCKECEIILKKRRNK